MKFIKRFTEATPEYWKGVRAKAIIFLAVIGALHTADAADAIDLPEKVSSFFIYAELILGTLISTASNTKDKA